MEINWKPCRCPRVTYVFWLSLVSFASMLTKGNVSWVAWCSSWFWRPPVDKSTSALSLLSLKVSPLPFGMVASKADMFRDLFLGCCGKNAEVSRVTAASCSPVWCPAHSFHETSPSMNRAKLAHSRIIRCPRLVLSSPHPCSNPPMTPRLTSQQMRGQYLRAWEDKDWIWAVCVHSNETLPSSGIGLRAVQLNLDVNTCWARLQIAVGWHPPSSALLWKLNVASDSTPLQGRVQILVFRCCCAWLFLLALWLLTFLLACLLDCFPPGHSPNLLRDILKGMRRVHV